jgi:predicted site-specific integrase-resolvase
VESGDVKEIVVTYKDRLCRYGIELIERIFRTYNTTLVVLCDEVDTEETELGTDLLDICNFFVAKRNGKKSAKFRNERKKTVSSITVSNENTSLSSES